MPDLAILQTTMARALASGDWQALAGEILPGPVGADEALGLHRNTALAGLAGALRLSCPTVDALVGEVFFDQAALAFAAAHPPSTPWLAGYGSGFPDFLAAYPPAEGLPYLADVARLDLAVEAAAQDALGRDGLVLDLGGAILTLDASLRVLDLGHPAVAIRDAVESGDEALAALDVTPRPNAHALWRVPHGAALRPLNPVSAAFLIAVLTGGDVEAALSGGDPALVQSDVLTAPFARLTVLEDPQ
ncbi:MAG TPA: DNA-binding domain-containing protein [Caulobacteraceae bacterium]|nr:DNA-binding domain-containing protein [Caulobacteraceae bacterium]